MEIKFNIEARIIVENGAANFNEIMYAVGNWSDKVRLEICKGVIETYQQEMVKQLCSGAGETHWAKHEIKGGKKGQMCIGGSYRSAGVRKKEREFRTDLGSFSVKMKQIKCDVCGKRFAALLPLLDIPARQKATVKIKHMMSETLADVSYRKGSSQLFGLGRVTVPKSTLHRWMTGQDWDILTDGMHTENNWRDFNAIMADGTGYKQQGGKSTKGEMRIVMGVSTKPKKMYPLGVWADKSWKEIDEKLNEKRPENVKAPLLVIDGEKGQKALGNLAGGIQRCQWHASNQLGYFLWQDGLAKNKRDDFLKRLSGIIKIELPQGDFKEVTPEMKKEVKDQLKKSRESMENLINSFQRKGYWGATTYLKNATGHLFTVVEKWLELGYMPPKAISLLERVMREMGRRIKKIGASWKQKGLLAIAHVLLTRIYSPEQWKEYWAKLLDLQNRCFFKSYHLNFAGVS